MEDCNKIYKIKINSKNNIGRLILKVISLISMIILLLLFKKKNIIICIKQNNF